MKSLMTLADRAAVRAAKAETKVAKAEAKLEAVAACTMRSVIVHPATPGNCPASAIVYTYSHLRYVRI